MDYCSGAVADSRVPQIVATVGGQSPVPLSSLVDGARRWADHQGVFLGATSTYDRLPAGLYRAVEVPMAGIGIQKQLFSVDSLLVLPDSEADRLVAEFNRFWTLGTAFRDRGFLQKRGLLLWGPPGSGKTSAINLMVQSLIKKQDGVVLFVDHPGLASAGLRLMRQIEPERPIVVILEDIDALANRYGEHEFLSLLDGEAQVDRVVFVATTNYPERLDKRFIDRPSRFDTISFIDMPSASARRAFLAQKEKSLSDDELSVWVDLSEGFSIAHLKEMIIAVKCFGQSLESVVERLKEMQEGRPSSEQMPSRRTKGFLGGALRDHVKERQRAISVAGWEER